MEAMSHPRDWKPVHFANVGTDEAFIREMLELITILEGSLILGEQREKAMGAILTIMNDGLIPAFMELRTIRAPETASLPIADRLQPYEDFARKLWKAYKDLTQRTAEIMGFDIGFLYQKDTKFEEGERMDFKKFYDNAVVEKLFESVWGTIVDLLVILLSLKLPPRTHIVMNDPNVHGPWPNRFRWVIEGLG